MKKHLLSILFLLFSLLYFTSHAQSNKLVKQMTELEKLAWQKRQTHPREALAHANEGLKIAIEQRDTSFISDFLNRKGNAYESMNAFDSAAFYFEAAYEIDSLRSFYYGIGRAANQLAQLSKKSGQYAPAINYANKAIDYFEQVRDKKYINKVRFAIPNSLAIRGESLSKLGKHVEALGDFSEAINKVGELPVIRRTQSTLGSLYSMKGLTYERIHSYQLAIHFHLKNLELQQSMPSHQQDSLKLANIYHNLGNNFYKLGKLDSATILFHKSLETRPYHSSKLERSYTLHSLGGTYLIQHDLEQAEAYFQKSVALGMEIDNPKGLADTYYGLGQLKLAQGDIPKAQGYFQQSLEISQESGLVEMKMLSSERLSKIFSARGKLQKALSYQDQATRLKDSLEELEDQLSEDMFLADMQAQENSFTGKLLSYQKQNIQIQRIFLVVVIGLLFVVVVAFYQSIVSRNKVDLAEKERLLEVEKVELADKKLQLQEEKVKNLLKNQEIKFIEAMVEGQEKERKRISQDLHDRVGGMLTVLTYHFNNLRDDLEELGDYNTSNADKADQLLKETFDAVRSISHDLGDNFLERYGLKAAVEDLVSTLQNNKKYGLGVYADIDLEDERMPEEVERNIFKIIQELVSNVLRHAQATRLSIEMFHTKEEEQNILRIMVVDNGIGLDKDQVNNSDGMGLKGIQRKLDKINGSWTIDANAKAGTTIIIDIPEPHQKKDTVTSES